MFIENYNSKYIEPVFNFESRRDGMFIVFTNLMRWSFREAASTIYAASPKLNISTLQLL